MIIDESKCRLLNKGEESEETVNIPLIMRLHPFLHHIHFYRLRHLQELIKKVITLLSFGCSIRAIFAVFGLDERNGCSWQDHAELNCKSSHKKPVAMHFNPGRIRLNEPRFRQQGRIVWMDMALCGILLHCTDGSPFIQHLLEQPPLQNARLITIMRAAFEFPLLSHSGRTPPRRHLTRH